MARKQDKELENEQVEVVEENSAEPRIYELSFHIDPELSHEDVKQVYQSIKDTTSGVGTVIAVGEPEKMQLAYTISRMEHEGRHDFSSSFFAWIGCEVDTAGHAAILAALNDESRIFRFIDVLTTKDAIEHAAEQRDLRTRTQQGKAVKTEESSEKALDNALENATA